VRAEPVDHLVLSVSETASQRVPSDANFGVYTLHAPRSELNHSILLKLLMLCAASLLHLAATIETRLVPLPGDSLE
jgi:hypothetical protein